MVGERVPSGIWRDSQECGSIQESVHFAKACAQVVQLRRELAAAEDYERLSARATELRKGLAEAPIVATSDPLPAAFNATLGRFVPIGGTEGVALLLTVVVELMSCFGLAGLSVLNKDKQNPQRSASPATAPYQREQQERDCVRASNWQRLRRLPLTLPKVEVQRLPRLSNFLQLVRVREPARPPPRRPSASPARAPEGQAFGQASRARPLAQSRPGSPLHSLPMALPKTVRPRSAGAAAVTEFVALLERADGARATGSELFRAYATQRASYGWPELKPNTFGVHLKVAVQAVGGRKFKSCGQVYEGVRIPPAWREQLVQSA